jgi:hypothetical protein
VININDYSPELVKEWDPVKNANRTPFNTAYGSDYRIFWICSVCGNNGNLVRQIEPYIKQGAQFAKNG